ncbi:MAG: SPFH domain-containing protein [Methylomonas sp.]|jgi:regulator of protease activity HflC (stomatin/prohibitin superfamily)
MNQLDQSITNTGAFRYLFRFSFIKILLAVVVVLSLLSSAFYTVNPSEMANLRRLGTIVYEEPVGPGPHLKMPLIDTVDKLQVSLTTLHIPPFDVNTIDNQKITLDMNFNFIIPKNKVNHLLYEVGKPGNEDISESIIPVVKDRTGRVFNKQNTTSISQNRQTIQDEVTDQVFKALTEQFGIAPHSLQLAQIIYSPAFIQSNENAVKAKNDAVAEQNKQVVETAKAQQKVISAKGEADAAIEAATGAARSVVINAEADKDKQALDGEGQAARLKLEIGVFNNNPELYIKYLQAKAQLQWNGQSPLVVSGGNGQNAIVVPVGLPAVNAK